MTHFHLDKSHAEPDQIAEEILSLDDDRAKSGRILLVGMGADIGSNLLYLSTTPDVAYPITDVLTHPVDSEGIGAADRGPLEELKVRLLLANPYLFGRITTDDSNCSLTINGYSFRIHFRDLNENLDDLGYFDLTVLATSRHHIRSRSHLDKLESISRVVIGVAENSSLPALYPALLTANSKHFLASHTVVATELSGSYAMGSCQCVGWTTGLRILADLCANQGVALHDILLHTEVDIVHPDTASSNFGTKRVGPRSEDPRDNLRPGISQVAESMLRFHPASSVNNVSLRVLTQPPGYQIQRFFLHGIDIRTDDIIGVAKTLGSSEPYLIHVTNSPIGSRSYAYLPCSIVLLVTEQHISVKRVGNIVEVVLQAFVHNTLGYCAAILSATDRILRGDAVTFIDSHNQTV
ncbi:hypothetical protein [Xenorhabdus innexi]|uniref:Uncharacterized protein n=1 Tax=Xenorhabdus innexi TaxID=290109 RepID=A0A1N6MQD8_9GAMM|nr:hypothetical protein [Xenorhabdus innexi]PHM31276.1 hypothetical protein Xinn_02917 [Xenorhabdus innexi]SIP70974.1 hypothetical protein XIS1_1030005 [Xenorhabdus innexi]